jgi:hypothetical protein
VSLSALGEDACKCEATASPTALSSKTSSRAEGTQDKMIYKYGNNGNNGWEHGTSHASANSSKLPNLRSHPTVIPGMARADHKPHLPVGPPGSGPSVSFARSCMTGLISGSITYDPRAPREARSRECVGVLLTAKCECHS